MKDASLKLTPMEAHEMEVSTLPVVAVILAAGSGTRLRSASPKQLMKLAGKPVLAHTLTAFENVPAVNEILVVTRSDLVETCRDIIAAEETSKVTRVLIGGEARSDSTRAALGALQSLPDAKVLIHDAVRPFVSRATIEAVIEQLNHHDAVDVAITPADTIIEVQDDTITAIPDRSGLRRGQTPQGFRLATLRRAYALAPERPGQLATDDCGVVNKYLPDVAIKVVEGSTLNIKLTHPIDVYVADKIFQIKTLESSPIALPSLKQRIEDKHIVVFGGSAGIGEAIAELGTDLGANMHCFSRTTTGTDIQDAECTRSAISSVIQSTGTIHHVVNSAGILRIKPMAQQSDEEILELINVNYLGAINVARAAYPHLRDSRGHLLFFTSSSFTRGRGHYAVYTSSKAAVVNLAQALAEEWSDAGIRVNCMNPDRTLTRMRVEAFGAENPATLLSAEKVARRTLETLVGPSTGQVFDVRR